MITRQELEGQWNEVKGQVKERWGQLSDDDLARAEGNADQLVGVIQQKTGESRSNIEEFLQKAIDDGASTMDQVARTARAYAEQASEKYQETIEQVSGQVEASYAEAEAMVQRKPVESVAVAFGAGIITGVVVGLALQSR
ncbi:MAG: CsbD family protein [Maioricimonas sp. JB049]